MKPKLHESRPVDIRKEDQLWKRFHDELRAITVRIDKLKALKRGEVQLNATWIKPTRVQAYDRGGYTRYTIVKPKTKSRARTSIPAKPRRAA